MPRTRLRKGWDLEDLTKALDLCLRNRDPEKCDLDVPKFTKRAVAGTKRAQASCLPAQTPSYMASGCRPDWASHPPSFLGLHRA
jgi:hypothetical protein